MAVTECDLFEVNGGRESIRRLLVETFLKEAPGAGRGKLKSEYRYFVERLPSGRRISLYRPARINRGFDFVVELEGGVLGKRQNRRWMPSHNDLLSDIALKWQANSSNHEHLWGGICEVFDSSQITEAPWMASFSEVGMEIREMFLTMKWLFIEQDITYWNWSGRAMLKEAITLTLDCLEQ